MSQMDYHETNLTFFNQKIQTTGTVVAEIEKLLDKCTDTASFRTLTAARDELIDKMGILRQQAMQHSKAARNDNQPKNNGTR